VLGACGVVSNGALMLVIGALPSRHLQHGWGAMLAVVFTLLLVRSSMHVRAGLVGLRAASFDQPGELATRYASFGVISALCVGGVLALLALAERVAPGALLSVGALCWLLMAWPTILKRYVRHRQFAELLAGDQPRHRRAPDAGLTALGWLLAGHATLVAAVLTIAATVEPAGPGHALARLLTLAGPAVGRSTGQLALGAAMVALEGVAGVALIRMSDHRRTFATIYALVGGAVALAVTWPLLRSLPHHHLELAVIARLVPTVLQIVLPAAALVLVHRPTVPAAQARYRPLRSG
jgi:hypothetical protein